METRRYIVKTLGCKANLYDTQAIEAELRRKGWVAADPNDSEAELCIVNSCTVTDEADRQSRKLATRLAKTHPRARVVFTGCAAEVAPEKLAKTSGIDLVVGNQDKYRLLDLLDRARPERGQVLGTATDYSGIASRHPEDREWNEPQSAFLAPSSPELAKGMDSGTTRAFLKVQEGCDAFCTYCIIPYGRGKARSLSLDATVERVSKLVQAGTREVVLTGTNLGEFGADWAGSPQLEALVETILDRTALERLRVSSLDPVEITPRLLKRMESDPRFCPHFHVSLQSPHSRILKLMKRKYGFEQAKDCLERIAQLPAPAGGAFVGMDVITGFPGETEEEFGWGLEALGKLPWSRLHVFPYSERAGTPATRLSAKVKQQERVRRASALREMSLERLRRLYQDVLGQYRLRHRPISGVLLESRTRGPDGTDRWYAGYSPNYLRCLVPMSPEPGAEPAYSNQIVTFAPETVVVDRAAGDVALTGRILLTN